MGVQRPVIARVVYVRLPPTAGLAFGQHRRVPGRCHESCYPARCLILGLDARLITSCRLLSARTSDLVTTKTTGRLNRLEFSEIEVADYLQSFGRRAILQVGG